MYNDQSKYCYRGSDVLINHANLRDQKQLDEFERVVTYHRALELQLNPIIGRFDLDHLRAIHKYIFQDVYPFAGSLREENIAKGAFRFCHYQYIESEANRLFRELAMEQFLQCHSREEISERLAHYMAEINVLHPFREGNGRVQREFIRSLALINGYDLSWQRIDPGALLQASKQSVSNSKPLAHLLHQAIQNVEPDHNLIRRIQIQRDR